MTTSESEGYAAPAPVAAPGSRTADAERAKSGTVSLAFLGITGILAVAGLALWAYQLSSGLIVTDMRNLSSWGLYITMFMFFIGLSAGGLIIATVPRVFNLRGFKSVSKVAVFSSICCTILATAFVVIDLGRPERVWHLIAYSNFTSPLMWDIIVITTYLIVSIVYLRANLRAEKGQGSEKALKVLSLVALVTAVLVHSVTAWIFGLQIARPFWNTALLAPMFISSALVSGLALTLFVVVVLNKTGYLKTSSETLSRMGSLLGTFVLVDLFLLFCELLTAGFPLAGTEFSVVQAMLTGVFAPMFWTEVVGGLLAAYLVMNKKTQAVPTILAGASLLAILGIFFKRFQLLLGGFEFPNLTYFSIPTGPDKWSSSALVYVPTAVEWGIVIGVVGLGALLLGLGLKYLPLKAAEQA